MDASSPFELLRETLTALDVVLIPVEGSPAFRMLIQGEHGQMPAIIGLYPDRQELLTYVGCASQCPADRRDATARFVTRANHGLPIGCFELDLDDGEVRFKSSVDYQDVGLSAALIRNVLAPAVFSMDRYLPALQRVMFGGLEPDAAIAEIEG